MSISGAGGSTISPEIEKVNGFSSVSLLPILILTMCYLGIAGGVGVCKWVR